VRHHLVDRELPLGQDLQHLVADGTRGADHRHLVAHEDHPALWLRRALGQMVAFGKGPIGAPTDR